jgi:hypothetical protein
MKTTRRDSVAQAGGEKKCRKPQRLERQFFENLKKDE